MELDTLIIYVLLILFFVLPSVLRRKKKKGTAQRERQSSGLGKLGERLRAFMRELETQALEAKKKADQQAESDRTGQAAGPQRAKGKSVWDLLTDREAEEAETVPYTELSAEVVSEPLAEPEPVRPSRAVRNGRPETVKKVQRPETPVPAAPVRAVLPAHALQQAVVWSEILGPPKALRQD